MKNYQALVIAGSILFVSAQKNFAASFTNGTFQGTGFVTTDPTRPGWMYLPTGSTLIPGWTVVSNPASVDASPLGTGNGVDWQTNWIAPAPGCTFSVDLNGYGTGGIQQTFDTTPGQHYLVTFELCGNVHDFPNQKVGSVSAAGQSTQFQFDDTNDTATSPGWVSANFAFTANSSSTTLLFEGLNANAGGPVIDAVTVSAVPEPASLSLLSLATVVVLRRRKHV